MQSTLKFRSKSSSILSSSAIQKAYQKWIDMPFILKKNIMPNFTRLAKKYFITP